MYIYIDSFLYLPHVQHQVYMVVEVFQDVYMMTSIWHALENHHLLATVENILLYIVIANAYCCI